MSHGHVTLALLFLRLTTLSFLQQQSIHLNHTTARNPPRRGRGYLHRDSNVPVPSFSYNIQQKRWPRLSLFALDILSIPAMSDKPERVFSGARRTITWDKAQLNPDTIEVKELLQDWKRTDILGDLSYNTE
jgi:hypothetical protein